MALEKIINYKKNYVKNHRQELENLKKFCINSPNSLEKILKYPGLSYICEIKPASPSLGVINNNLDLKQVTKYYNKFCDAISVLADKEFFGSSLENIKQVRKLVSKPILFKDIIVSPLQIYQASYYGADAVLLMLSVLNNYEYQECSKLAQEFNLDIICEVHTKQELERAVKLGVNIIGINNRNLYDLSINLENTNNLLSLIPENKIIISESGYATREQIKNISNKVDAVLVGSALMKAAQPDLKLRELIFGRVKICGITNYSCAQQAYNSGAYFGGLNFYTGSSRCVSISQAQEIIKFEPRLIWGGVFVNQDLNFILDIINKLGLNFVQLHGDENQDFIKDLREKSKSNLEIWRALRIKNNIPELDFKYIDKFVLDSFCAKDYGGTGKKFNWDLIKNNKNKIILAGGINLSNCLEAMNINTFAIDIASGVESLDPRKKDSQKLENLFSRLRGR